MTRHLVGLVCVFALVVVPLVGCGETEGTGGMGGDGGQGGMGGDGGQGGNGVVCSSPAGAGLVCPCTEAGIRAAIAEGYARFDCDGPTTVVTETAIVIDNNVTLYGDGNLTVDGNDDHPVFLVPEGIEADLRDMTLSRGAATDYFPPFLLFPGAGITNMGFLTLSNVTVGGHTGVGVMNAGSMIALGSTVVGSTDVGVRNEGYLTLVDCTVSQNARGGITNNGDLVVSDSVILGNSGSGIYSGLGTVMVTHTVVSDNVALSSGSHTRGGGIYSSSSTLTVANSTVSGNTARSGFGGGIYSSSGPLTRVTNSTVSGNTASFGGGIATYGALVMTNSTVSENTANEAWGSALWSDTAEVTLINSAVVGTVAQVQRPSDPIPSRLEARGTLIVGTCIDVEEETSHVSLGHNIESPGDTCGFDQSTDQVNVSAGDLNLGPLQDNGGPTETHALGAGSVAIDHIPAVDCVDADGEPLTTDQRGEPRPGGTMCDVGAFEVQP